MTTSTGTGTGTGYEQHSRRLYKASIPKQPLVIDFAQFGLTAAPDHATKRALNMGWAIFVAATLLLCATTEISGAVDPEIILIALGAVKGRITLGWLMEARAFPLTWRNFCEAWLLVAAALTITSRLPAHWCF